jgi:structural maintenance of chromosome 2
MHIIEIILDGFKSYSTRTIIGGKNNILMLTLTCPIEFDPQFNAITGLNGSGKSNILDAICFVLGITRLQHMRAENLQELIYKQGNAGVSKATVSIKFNNKNKSQSPPGYEEHEFINVTRTIES